MTFGENFVQWAFLTAKKWHKFWHPGFASRALRFKISQKLSLSLSLSSLSLGQCEPVFFFGCKVSPKYEKYK
jgi:hypothetical protein